MSDNRENGQQPEATGRIEDNSRDRTEQFNELSELSLEERMAVADQIGIPVYNVGEAAATGTMSNSDDGEGSTDERMEEETQDAGQDR